MMTAFAIYDDLRKSFARDWHEGDRRLRGLIFAESSHISAAYFARYIATFC